MTPPPTPDPKSLPLPWQGAGFARLAPVGDRPVDNLAVGDRPVGDDTPAAQATAALSQLANAINAPRLLQWPATDLASLWQAHARAAAQLAGRSHPFLIVALAGGTGAGKSSLINALAGADVAVAGTLRPTTTRLHVYHHRDLPGPILPAELAAQAHAVAHDRPELFDKVLVDTPDLDSLATEHRALTQALLKAAGLVLYVFSAQNYRDERVWSVLSAERRFSSAAAVLNKADLLDDESLASVVDDLRQCWANIGLADVRVFRTVARRESTGHAVNDLPALRAYLERELRDSDVARMLAKGRQAAVDHLAAAVDRLAPRDLATRLAAIETAHRHRLEGLALAVAEHFATSLATLEGELAPAVTLRQHDRFVGPLRVWLGLTDFLRFGLPGIVRRVCGRPTGIDRTAIDATLRTTPTANLEGRLRSECQTLADQLYAAGLPVKPWAVAAAGIDASALMARLAGQISTRFEVAISEAATRRGWVVFLGSALGTALPAAAVVFGLVIMGRQLLAQPPVMLDGLALLGHLTAMLVLALVALQGVISALLPSARRLAGGVAASAAHVVLLATFEPLLTAYRTALHGDLAALHDPIESLRTAAAASPVGPFPSSSQTAVVETRAAAADIPLADTLAVASADPPPPTAPSAPPQAAADPGKALIDSPPPVFDLAARLRQAQSHR